MFRRLFWLSSVAGVAYIGYRFWRWVQDQNQPSPFLNEALAGRLYDQPATSAPAAYVNATGPAAPAAPARRIVTRVHKGAPPSTPATPAAEASTGEAPAAPVGEGLSFGPEIVGAAETPVEAAPVAEQAEAAPAAESGALTNINSADEDALVALPGIGRSLARRIIAYRNENGPFASIDALEAIQGIGSRNIDEFRHLVTV